MIEFHTQNNYQVQHANVLKQWVLSTITAENKILSSLTFVFCDDDYLLELNIKHLNHNTLTDIITFDYSIDALLTGEVYISTERVIENAITFSVDTFNELCRVIIHGVLHLCGYADKTDAEQIIMRDKENFYLESLKKQFFA